MLIVDTDKISSNLNLLKCCHGSAKIEAKALLHLPLDEKIETLIFPGGLNDRRSMRIAVRLFDNNEFISYLRRFFERSNASTFFPSYSCGLRERPVDRLIIDKIGSRRLSEFLDTIRKESPKHLVHWDNCHQSTIDGLGQ